ncbi:MAG TPA: hypothetical protein VN622_17670 [Clostridia bacterium]|nr:hypothetical protein [Clostridia bacterium]
MPAGAAARLRLRGRGDIPILLVDLATIDGTSFYWANVSGAFPRAADGAQQVYKPWIKSAGPFSQSRDFTTDGGDIVVQNLSGNTIERDVSKALRDHEFEGTLAVLREYDELLGVVEEFHGRLFEQGRDATEASFRMVQIFDANEYEIADVDYQEGCPLRYKSDMCGSVSGLATCPKKVSDCVARNNTERFMGCPNPPPVGVLGVLR